MKAISIFLLFLPVLVLAQTDPNITYQERKDNCRRMAEEKNKATPDAFVYFAPDCMIGAMTPEFSAITFEGKSFTSDSLKGKITILNFWMISCPPCIAEIPGLNNVIKKYGRAKINYIAIGMDDTEDVNRFLQRHPWEFDQLTSGETIILGDFKMGWGFPTTFVVNQEGVIIGAFSGGKPDESAVQEVEDELSVIIDKALR